MTFSVSLPPFQVEVALDGSLKAVHRYSVDKCVCGHTWEEHYQPRRGRKASCWATPKGVLCDCHDFMFAG